ncbi:MAG: type II toxin-antitoxin system PemK/MazF family toxin [Microcoleus sp.]
MVDRYIPNRGDLVWFNFDPSIGREQQGRRPAIVLTLAEYNRASNLAVMLPITSKRKGYPFEVLIPPDCPIQGVILCDHLKALDWQQRQVSFIAKAPDRLMLDIRLKLDALLYD